jgi:hypothetical protein
MVCGSSPGAWRADMELPLRASFNEFPFPTARSPGTSFDHVASTVTTLLRAHGSRVVKWLQLAAAVSANVNVLSWAWNGAASWLLAVFLLSHPA